MTHLKETLLKDRYSSLLLILDISMLALLLFNVVVLTIDWLLQLSLFEALFMWLSSDLYLVWQGLVHQNIDDIHAFFIAVFLTEFALRWAYAIYKKEYPGWFYYGLYHSYDLLGCIPHPAFIIFRFFRLGVIAFRLDKLGIIKFRESTLGNFLTKHKAIVVEEISDAVVVNVLEGIQVELQSGHEFSSELNEQLIKPNIDKWVKGSVGTLNEFCKSGYEEHRGQIHTYIRNLIFEVTLNEPVVKAKLGVPFLGDKLKNDLATSIANHLMMSIDIIVDDLTSNETDQMIESIIFKLIEDFVQDKFSFSDEIMPITMQLLDLLKKHVAKKTWQESYFEMVSNPNNKPIKKAVGKGIESRVFDD